MGTIYLHLPFKTGIEECEGGRSWGFYYFMNEGFEDINLIPNGETSLNTFIFLGI